MNRLLFLDLLYAVHNIGGNSEPETDDDWVANEAALLFAEGNLFPTVSDIKALNLRWDEEDQDVLIREKAIRLGVQWAVSLYAECLIQPDPEQWARERISSIYGHDSWEVGEAASARKSMMECANAV